MAAFLYPWLELLGRWLHIIAGIAWIGASFYFVWLDNHLLAPARRATEDNGPDAIAGEVWAVHGGGFYQSQKYRTAPAELPGTLHWFYWEAYTTWVSGMFLLCLMYYARAEQFLIDPSVLALSKPAAIGCGLASMGLTWFAYDGLCRSRLGAHPRLLGLSVALWLTVLAWGLCQLFGGRGAYLHFGAALGTLMVANVFAVIIPGQRELVRAKREQRAVDPQHGIRGKQRSVHNTYFTLPVLFTMISHHYPLTYGAELNWLLLLGMSAAGAAIRAWFVLRHKAHERNGRTPWWPAVTGVVMLAGVTVLVLPRSESSSQVKVISFARVESIVAQRCQPCHSVAPTQPGFVTAPGGVLLDTREHILAALPRIELQLVTRAMPIGNLTGMTDAERAAMLAWIRHGSPR
jgi:uncharacterized membrane protein